MLLLVLCFLMSALAAQCKGRQHSNCATDQCRAGHVPIDVCADSSAVYGAGSECTDPNCKRCDQNPAECEECNSGFDLDGSTKQCISSNTNKSSGLSTGAIAGIAVAAVIIVGGLVGFLCWWFLCRGKA
ncbi:Variant-specific surface protein VSP4A1 [Giardia duodenalis]|uniref:Variant-specific surface protein VSP4A1 n=1 Tax=Giardia intestinalis (strain ATCC 50803 / WB clone C6) TaxID=184922 RepID=A8BLI8_GIAIC|nr:Variant-specific surface protein VSP4A1 [Giardia intestinalis]KAE8302768.1 Variant-specific surface protein VSP4A1 [Giardia intestinalis]|eukprot:XP_001706303.1 Variant-specific surface protein VSP4A1 precursor [Giardia lamblia ATCC 50803]